MKERVDALLVERGLVASRERARALVLAGKVFSGEQRIDKAGTRMPVDAPLEVRGPDHPYVSRGGVKLEGALRALSIEVGDKIAADIGASTGGFTDALLQHGVRRVYAIDVGYGQLASKLRDDPRAVVMERTNARYLDADTLGEPVDLVTIDVSFIGLDKILPVAHTLAGAGGEVIVLVKPQFEAGAERIGKGGVVRDPAVRGETVDRVASDAEQLGLEVLGRTDSPIAGPKGNIETFLWLRKAGRGH